jgi:hypothetical protein
MYIPSYQIHNVLKVYSRQVSQSRIIERQKSLEDNASVDRINISAEGKRKVIIEKVASDIVDRITRFGPQDNIDHTILSQLQDEIGKEIEFNKEDDSKFVYNTIDDNNNKQTNSLPVNGSSFLVERLQQIAQEEVDKNMES